MAASWLSELSLSELPGMILQAGTAELTSDSWLSELSLSELPSMILQAGTAELTSDLNRGPSTVLESGAGAGRAVSSTRAFSMSSRAIGCTGFVLSHTLPVLASKPSKVASRFSPACNIKLTVGIEAVIKVTWLHRLDV